MGGERCMKLKVKNLDIRTKTILRLRGLGDSPAACKHLANTVRRLSDPYVPMQQGNLKNTAQIINDGRGILYDQPYAPYQYYGEVMAGRAPKHYTGRPLDYHDKPRRGPNWDKRMMADHGEEVMDDLARFVGGHKK